MTYVQMRAMSRDNLRHYIQGLKVAKNQLEDDLDWMTAEIDLGEGILEDDDDA